MPVTLRTMLCETRDALHALRRDVAARGHVVAMSEIDILMGIAEDEAIRAIKALDRSAQQS